MVVDREAVKARFYELYQPKGAIGSAPRDSKEREKITQNTASGGRSRRPSFAAASALSWESCYFEKQLRAVGCPDVPATSRIDAMTGSKIGNDDLGEWGEDQLRIMCSAAGMVANKAQRDKMGWDFIVELPPDASDRPLDRQPNRLSCRIQVKTQWRRRNARFVMSLSAAQRLAQDPGPSFGFMLIARRSDKGEDPALVECFLIHLIDKNLERILKRLRKTDAAAKATPLSEQTISFNPKDAGVRVELTGTGLKEALLGICGKDPHVYITRKDKQLRLLGYESGRYRLETTVVANNLDEFVEMMLGLRPTTIEKFATYDTRFGILRPVDHFPRTDPLQAEFRPGALKCRIWVRGEGLISPAVFPGEVVLPMVRDLPDEHRRMLIRARFFTLDLHANGQIDFRLDGQSLFDAELKLEEWRQHLRLLELMS